MKAITVYSLLWALFAQMIEVEGLPRSVIFIQWTLLIFGIGGLRFFAQWLLNYNPSKNELNIMIYGSGSAGHQLSISLKASKKYNPIAFIDDNPKIQGNSINGLVVIPPSKISDYIETKNVKEIFLAFLASPTHNADLSVAISGDDSESSFNCLSTVSLK